MVDFIAGGISAFQSNPSLSAGDKSLSYRKFLTKAYKWELEPDPIADEQLINRT